MKKTLTAFLILIHTVLLAEPISLEKCLDLALQNNLTLKAEQETEKAASQLKKSAYANCLPRLDFAGTYLKLNKEIKFSTEDFGVPLGNGYTAIPVYDLSSGRPVPIKGQSILLPEELKFGKEDISSYDFTLTQPLFTGGKLYKQIQIAEKTKKISAYHSRLKKEEILIDAEKSYWNIVSLLEKKKTAEKNLELLKKLETDVANYLDEGILTKNELLKVKVKRNEGELNLLKIHNGIDLTKMNLNRLMGRPPSTPLEPADSITESLFIEKNQSTEKDKTWENRPEIRSLQEMIGISKDLIHVSRARYLPNIFLQAHYYQTKPNLYNNFADELGGDWMVGIFFQMEIFNFGNRHFQTSALKSERKSLEYQLEEAKNKIILEITQKEYQLEQAAEKMNLAFTRKEQAAENLKITSDYYYEGMVNTSVYLEAQAIWLKSSNEWIESKKEQRIVYLEYLKSLGLFNPEGE